MLDLIQINKSYHTYKGKKPVLNDLSLTIEDGDRILIMGESGCGKTTLLNILSGLLLPDSGSLIYGTSKSNLNFKSEQTRAKYRYQYVGLIPQGICLINQYSVLDNLCFALHEHHISIDAAKEKSLQILQEMRLSEIAYDKVKHLSMGQKQRVAIARALLLESPLILADEPTSALDQASSELVLNLLNRSSSTLLLVSHDLSVASICNKIYLLDNGRLKEHCLH